MGLTKEDKKTYQREYMRIKRSNKRSNILVGSNRKYHPLIYALTDPIKRAKLQSVCDELGKRHLLDRLYYGIGKNSIDFSIVNQMLEATR